MEGPYSVFLATAVNLALVGIWFNGRRSGSVMKLAALSFRSASAQVGWGHQWREGLHEFSSGSPQEADWWCFFTFKHFVIIAPLNTVLYCTSNWIESNSACRKKYIGESCFLALTVGCYTHAALKEWKVSQSFPLQFANCVVFDWLDNREGCKVVNIFHFS